MRSSLCVLFSMLLALPLLSGCASIGPGGAAPGLIHSNVTYPNDLAPGMSYRINFEREDIEILKPVEVTATSHWYLLLLSHGDSGYGRLMEQARAAGGDGVLNVTIDTEFRNYLIFYARVTTKLTGLAYRYRRDGTAAGH